MVVFSCLFAGLPERDGGVQGSRPLIRLPIILLLSPFLIFLPPFPTFAFKNHKPRFSPAQCVYRIYPVKLDGIVFVLGRVSKRAMRPVAILFFFCTSSTRQ